MTVKDLKKLVKKLPKEMDSFDIVYTDIKISSEKITERKNVYLKSTALDFEKEELVFLNNEI